MEMLIVKSGMTVLTMIVIKIVGTDVLKRGMTTSDDAEYSPMPF